MQWKKHIRGHAGYPGKTSQIGHAEAGQAMVDRLGFLGGLRILLCCYYYYVPVIEKRSFNDDKLWCSYDRVSLISKSPRIATNRRESIAANRSRLNSGANNPLRPSVAVCITSFK